MGTSPAYHAWGVFLWRNFMKRKEQMLLDIRKIPDAVRKNMTAKQIMTAINSTNLSWTYAVLKENRVKYKKSKRHAKNRKYSVISKVRKIPSKKLKTMTGREISEAVRCEYHHVYSVLKKHGIKFKKTKISVVEKIMGIPGQTSEMTIREMSEKTGCSWNSVYQALRRHGIPFKKSPRTICHAPEELAEKTVPEISAETGKVFAGIKRTGLQYKKIRNK